MVREKGERADRRERWHERFEKKLDRLEESIDRLTERGDRLTRDVDRTTRDVSRLTDGLGVMSESLLTPSIRQLLLPFGLVLDGTAIVIREARHVDGDTLEIDFFCPGRPKRGGRLAPGRLVVVAEIKFRLSQRDVDDFLTRQIPAFHRFFPEYAKCRIVGAVGGVTVPAQVTPYAQRKGLFVLAPGGDVARALNRETFRPRVWPARTTKK